MHESDLERNTVPVDWRCIKSVHLQHSMYMWTNSALRSHLVYYVGINGGLRVSSF